MRATHPTSRWLICVAALALCPCGVAADVGGELGVQSALRTTDGDWTRRRLYGLLDLKTPIELSQKSGSTLTLRLETLAMADLEDDAAGSTTSLSGEIREASASLQTEHVTIKAGAQQIAWGETFGFYIADVVNPRDLSDPLFNDPEWQRLSVVAVNAQILLDAWSLQAIVTPVARRTRLPGRIQGMAILDPASSGRDPVEGGARIGRLFESGIDARIFVYSHQSRSPALQLTTGASGPALTAVHPRVLSAGGSASYVQGDYVFRTDVVGHWRTPVTASDLGSPIVQTHWQGILGSDVTLADSDWTLGGQYHWDAWSSGSSRNSPAGITQHAVSARVVRPLLNGQLVPECFVHHGLTVDERWIRPQLSWLPGTSLSVTLRADLVQARNSLRLEDGALSSVADEDRVLLWVSLKL